MQRPLLGTALLSILALSACQSMSGGMSALNGALSSISSLSGGISQFTSSLNGVPGMDQLKQIAGFSDQAGKLASALQGASGGAPADAQGGIDKLGGLLSSLGGKSFSLDSLKGLAPEGLTAKVSELTNLGKGLGTTADSVLGMLTQKK